ncbi:hypothetical protein MHU86_25715 [Fragilaria crotonensis]|nr:hypothetical protein MHU86_25715 [Fragilaria crotonensis]
MSVVPKDSYTAVETEDTLPQDVHEIAALRNDVLAWTSLDPEFAQDVGIYDFDSAFCAFIFLPCFWPHLLIMSPLLCFAKTNFENRIRNQYWILTDTELKIVTKNYDVCCLPGCINSGDSVQTIPLESITECGSNNPRKGFVTSCCKPLSKLYVDTAGFVRKDGSPEHEIIGYGLARQDWFIREVMNRRDIVKGNHSLNACCEGAVVATPVMERGGSTRSAADRMKDITELHNSGVLTREEFFEKRKDIVDSI